MLDIARRNKAGLNRKQRDPDSPVYVFLARLGSMGLNRQSTHSEDGSANAGQGFAIEFPTLVCIRMAGTGAHGS